MDPERMQEHLEEWRQRCPEKFPPEDQIFGNIQRGDRIFIGTACGEPQYLVQALIDYVDAHPLALLRRRGPPRLDARRRALHRRRSSSATSGTTPSSSATNTRAAVNEGLADYTPIFLSEVPELLLRRVACRSTSR